MSERGRALLHSAAETFEELRTRITNGEAVRTEEIRAVEQTARSAMDWLEDTDRFQEAHELLDRIGQYVRRNAPTACALDERDGEFMLKCPVALAHVRIGFSIEMVVQEIVCSICGLDPRDCDHLHGHVYDGETAGNIIKKAEMLGVALVSRPRQPDARIMEQSVGLSDIREALGFDPPAGAAVLCDRCLSPCRGVQELPQTLH